MKKYIAVIVIGVFALLVASRIVEATQIPFKTICHHTPANQVTLNFQNIQSWLGHLGTPHSKSTYDTNGACQQVTPTPTPTEEPTPTPTEKPTVTPTPTDEPRVIPTPTDTPRTESKPEGCTQNCGVPACTASTPGQVANFHVFRNGDKAILKWWATGGNKVNIYYKVSGNASWQFSVIGVANTGYYEIGGLGTRDIDFAVEQVNDCQPGLQSGFMSKTVIDGATSTWMLFQ